MPLSRSRLLIEGIKAGPVLGLDTGSAVASLGVVAQGTIRAALVRPARSHCAGIPDAVAEVLEAAGVSLDQLAAIAIAIGPGSFTGLRVGLSYAKAIAAARNLPLVGVSSLDALVLCAGTGIAPGADVYPIIDARRGEVYSALYRFEADALQRMTGDLLTPLTSLVATAGNDLVFVGDSMAEQARALAEASGRRAVAAGGAELHLRGSYGAALGAARAARKETDQIAALQPLYIRPPDINSVRKIGEEPYGTPRGRTHPATARS